MTNDKAIEILSKRNYMCGECPFSGPDCKGCRLAEALDLAINALREKVDISNRALDLIDDLKDRGVINNHQRGILRRAIILGDNTNNEPKVCGNNPGWCDNCVSRLHCKSAKGVWSDDL